MDEPGDKEPVEAILRCPAEERTPDNIEATDTADLVYTSITARFQLVKNLSETQNIN